VGLHHPVLNRLGADHTLLSFRATPFKVLLVFSTRYVVIRTVWTLLWSVLARLLQVFVEVSKCGSCETVALLARALCVFVKLVLFSVDLWEDLVAFGTLVVVACALHFVESEL
jgi:hypothetical protein